MSDTNIQQVIYEEGTASENRKITVATMRGDILWEGIAKNLEAFSETEDWSVCEILVDDSDEAFEKRYDKGKIIIVY